MENFAHTPRRGEHGELLAYQVDLAVPWSHLPIDRKKPVKGLLCTRCGCFYEQIANAACPNRIVEIMKESKL